MRGVRTALTLALGVLAVAPAGASADVRTIRFGGELGNRYEPAELTVQAGDVVEWVGDFAAHPLRYRRSSSEPYSTPYSGPSPFRRTLSAAGDTFEFLCATHGEQGMRGVVTAVARVASRPLTRPPLLALRTKPREPVVGRPVTFIASVVAGTGEAGYTRYAWDLDGDGRVRPKGTADRVTKRPRVTVTYGRAGRRKISVTGSTTDPSAAETSTTHFRFVVAAKADDAPPKVTVASVQPATLAALLRSGALIRIRASEVARARIELMDGRRILGRVSRRLTRRTRAIRMRLSRGSKARLEGRHDVRLKLRIVARDDAGNRTTLRKTFIAR